MEELDRLKLVIDGAEFTFSEADHTSGPLRIRWNSSGAFVNTQTSTVRIVDPQAGSNSAPTFPDSETGARSVDENTAPATDFGTAIAANDLDTGDSLTYSLGSTVNDNDFAIVSSSGQPRTNAALDYETKSSYSVTVSVSDGKDAFGVADSVIDDTIEVTITVNNVNDAPVITNKPANGTLDVAEDTADELKIFRATDDEGLTSPGRWMARTGMP